MLKKHSAFNTALLGAILLLASLLRLNGIDFGLPYLYNPDESDPVIKATTILLYGDWNPHWFDWPGSIVIYALALFYALVFPGIFLYCRWSGIVTGLYPFLQGIIRDPTFLYLSGRLLVCFFAVLSIYVLYRLSEKLYGGKIASIAIWVLAISPLHIENSQCVRPDTTGTLLILISLYFLFAHLENGLKRLFCLAALFAGFSASAKYPLGLIFLPILIQAIVADFRDKKPLLKFFRDSLRIRTWIAKALFFAGIGFLISSPFVFFDPRFDFYRIFHFYFENNQDLRIGAGSLSGAKNFLWYLTEPLQKGIGGVFFEIFAALGLLRLLVSKNYKAYLLAVFPAAFFLLVGCANLKYDRWAIPLLPFEALFFALGFFGLLEWALRRTGSKAMKAVCIISFTLLLSGFSVWVLAGNRWYGNYLHRPDTRTMAKEWIESHLPTGSKIAYEQYSPQLHILRARHFELMNLDFAQIISKSIEDYREEGVSYLVVSDAFKSRYYAEPEKYPDQIARYESLKQGTKLIKSFSNKRCQGPGIEIYQIGRTETIAE